MRASKLICSICAVSSAAVMAAAPVGASSSCNIDDIYNVTPNAKVRCLADDEENSEESFKQKVERSSKAHIGLYACIGGAIVVIAGVVCLIAESKRK